MWSSVELHLPRRVSPDQRDAARARQGDDHVASKASAPLLAAYLGTLLPGANRAAFELAGLDFIDWAGIRPIVGALQTLAPPAWVGVRSPSRLVRRIFEILELGDILDIEPDAHHEAGRHPGASSHVQPPTNPPVGSPGPAAVRAPEGVPARHTLGLDGFSVRILFEARSAVRKGYASAWVGTGTAMTTFLLVLLIIVVAAAGGFLGELLEGRPR